MFHLWNGLADYVAEHRIEVLFGVASFHGIDAIALAQPLAYLHHHYLAPAPLRVRARPEHFQAMDVLPDTPGLHQAMLAYASDFSFITTSLKPHGVTWLTPGMQVASVDHAVWFHAPFRADEWLLHVMESPRASGARGLVHGRVYSRDGRLVASTSQQGLVRQRR